MSSLTGCPWQDFYQFTISGRRRRTVNRPIRFRDVADSTDVTVISSVSTSLMDRTNYVEANHICSLCKDSNNLKIVRNASVLLVDYSSISPVFVQGRLNQMPSGHRCVSDGSHRSLSQLPKPPHSQHQHNHRLTPSSWWCPIKGRQQKFPWRFK